MGDEERAGGAVPLGELMGRLMDSEVMGRYTGNERAAQAWFRANGDFEHRHTRGVFLKESNRQGVAPILYVYVDSSAMQTEFRADKDIYLVRLAHYGFDVSDIVFRLSQKGQGVRYEPPTPTRKVTPVHPELTAEELAQVDEAVAGLEGSLRDRVRAAMISSLRRDKSKGHTEG